MWRATLADGSQFDYDGAHPTHVDGVPVVARYQLPDPDPAAGGE